MRAIPPLPYAGAVSNYPSLRRWLARARSLDSTALGWAALHSPLSRLLRPAHLPLWRIGGWLYRYVRWWLLVWFAVWQIDPRLMVSSRSGLETLLQVTPAVLVAVLVFAVGSAFAIIQAVVSTYGMRAALLVPIDAGVTTTALRPLAILVVALVMSGQVPDTGRPAATLAAAAAIVVLATLSSILAAVVALPSAFASFLAPVNFGNKATADADFYFRTRALGMVGFRLGLLEQMLVGSLARNDAVSAGAAIAALGRLHWLYVAIAIDDPAIREYTYDDGTTIVGWFGINVGEALGRAGEAWLASPGSEDVYVKLADSLVEAGRSFAIRGFSEEADAIIMAQIRLGTSVHQAAPSGVVNSWAAAATGLAQIEAAAEEAGRSDLAVRALAAWCLTTSYVQTHFHAPLHPEWLFGIATFGPDAAFDGAADLILSGPYAQRFGTKMPLGAVAVVGNLVQAKEAYEQRDAPNHAPPPLRPRQE